MSKLKVILNKELSTNDDKLTFRNISEQQTLTFSQKICYSAFTNTNKLIDSSKYTKRTFDTNGFMKCIFTAYTYHYPLKITPDSIQLALQIIYSICINKNAEKYRHVFVDHEGKKELIFDFDDVSSFTANKMAVFFRNQLEKNVKNPEFVQNYTQTYSTSTIVSNTVSCMSIMNCMKEYFSFKCCTLCGIPYVVLDGTVEDWTNLMNSYQYFKNFFKTSELSAWFETFDNVMNLFLEMRLLNDDGEIEAPDHIKKIWSYIYSDNSYGSGEDQFCGWGRLFVPYNEKNELSNVIELCKKYFSPSFPEDAARIFTYNGKEHKIEWQDKNIDYVSMMKSIMETPLTFDINGSIYQTNIKSGFYDPFMNDENEICPNIGYTIEQ